MPLREVENLRYDITLSDGLRSLKVHGRVRQPTR